MLPDGALTITTQLIMDGVEVKLGDKLPYDPQNWGLGAARGGMPVKVPRVKLRTSLSIMALCAFSQGVSAATISITKEVFAGNAPFANPPSPALHSGNFLQRMTGSIHYFAISPYAFNTGPGQSIRFLGVGNQNEDVYVAKQERGEVRHWRIVLDSDEKISMARVSSGL